MSITTTIAAAQNALPAMRNLVAAAIPLRAAYRLSKIVREVDEELKLFEEQRVALIKRLGEDDGNGNFTVKGDQLQPFHDELDPLLKTEFTINADKLNATELGNISISANDLMALEAFITQDIE